MNLPGRLRVFTAVTTAADADAGASADPPWPGRPDACGAGDAEPARSGGPAWAVGARRLLEGTVDKIARDSLQYVPFTQLANLTGTPAMSVPLHWTADGLPLACNSSRVSAKRIGCCNSRATRNRAAVVHPAARLGNAGLAVHRQGEQARAKETEYVGKP